MTDLTKIEKPFDFLDGETQQILMNHGGPYEFYSSYGGWVEILMPYWQGNVVYRVKPQPLTKPSIDWSHLKDEYKWLARDEDGTPYVYDSKPYINIYGWSIDDDVFTEVTAFKSFKPGTCDWKDSLIERPEGV